MTVQVDRTRPVRAPLSQISPSYLFFFFLKTYNLCLVFISNDVIVFINGNRTSCPPILLVIILLINK